MTSITDTTQRVLAHAGRIGGGGRKPFVEGTPEQIQEDHRERAREIMIQAARAKPWIEVDPETLERAKGGYLVSDDHNIVLERMTAPVWVAGDPRHELNPHMVWGWCVGSDGYVVFLTPTQRRSTSPAVFRAEEATRRNKQKMDELDRKTALLTTPILPVTLAELEGCNLPTLKAAAAIVNESGKLELVGDRLRVHLRIRSEREIDATRVLYASEAMVVDAIKHAGKGKEVSLPDVPVLAGGGIA